MFHSVNTMSSLREIELDTFEIIFLIYPYFWKVFNNLYVTLGYTFFYTNIDRVSVIPNNHNAMWMINLTFLMRECRLWIARLIYSQIYFLDMKRLHQNVEGTTYLTSIHQRSWDWWNAGFWKWIVLKSFCFTIYSK